MDLLDELEAMAQAALVSQDDDDIPESAIARWQKLFGYSTAMAETKITEHRNDPLRFTVSEDHWTAFVQAVIQAAGKSSADSTQVLAATDLSGQPSSFSKINGIDKLVIERWLRENPYPGFTPIFIQDLNAPKDLSSTSFHPTLGLDTTLPQYRLGSDEIPRPAQKEYPVWYFFYGTLADPSVLTKLLGSDSQAEYYAAKIRGGALKT
ncbi:hypothetical protein QL093DRAFT_2078216 [Fusarium oxysporum]|nr:hypothetical protein QL093DRAFT_2078216 [Fusarium oxysporum]